MPQHSMMCWPLHQRARLHRWSRPAPTASMCMPTTWTQWQADTLPCTSLYTKCTGRPKLPASTTIFISLRRRLCKQLGPSTGNISAASFLHKKPFCLNFLLSTDHVAQYMTVATSRVTTICSCDSLVHIRLRVARSFMMFFVHLCMLQVLTACLQQLPIPCSSHSWGMRAA